MHISESPVNFRLNSFEILIVTPTDCFCQRFLQAGQKRRDAPDIQHWHTKLKARVQGNAVNSPYELAPPTLADRGQAPFSFLRAVF